MQINNDIRLVLADIDLTLTYGMGEIPEINVRAIEELHKRGIWFGVASGRNIGQLKKRPAEWGCSFDFDIYIGVNGSSMLDNVSGIWEDYFFMEPEWMKDIVERTADLGYNMHAYYEDTTLYFRRDEHFSELQKNPNRKVVLAESAEDFYNQPTPAFKVIVTIPDEEMEGFRKSVKPLLDEHQGQFKLVRTSKMNLEFVNAKTSKLYPLEIFCKRHNITLDQCACFGDAENDLEIIKAAGMGVCLIDGEEKVKQQSRYLTDLGVAEGGFGDFVFKHLLKQ